MGVLNLITKGSLGGHILKSSMLVVQRGQKQPLGSIIPQTWNSIRKEIQNSAPLSLKKKKVETLLG